MCFSFESSIATFVLGTVLNIITVFLLPKPEVVAASLTWQFAIFMQLWDALLWLEIDNPCTERQSNLTGYALAFNLMQPVVAFLCGLFITKSFVSKFCASWIIGFYIIYMFFDLKNYKIDCLDKRCNKEGNHCNLHYGWWRSPNMGGLIYLMTLLSMLMLLLPFKFALTQAALVLITFFLAMFGFQRGQPSLWCFFAAFSPAFTALSYKLTLA